MTDWSRLPIVTDDNPRRLLVYGSMGAGKTEALRRWQEAARPRLRFAFIRSELAAILRGLGLGEAG